MNPLDDYCSALRLRPLVLPPSLMPSSRYEKIVALPPQRRVEEHLRILTSGIDDVEVQVERVSDSSRGDGIAFHVRDLHRHIGRPDTRRLDQRLLSRGVRGRPKGRRKRANNSVS